MKSLPMVRLLLIFVSTVALAQNNPIPFISQSLSPERALPGVKAFTLTVNGAGFVSGTTVNWNGSPRTTVFVSSDKLQASINATDVAAIGTASITVLNPAPGGGTSNVVYFPILKSSTTVAMSRSNHTLTSPGGGGVVIGDFNSDGKPDVAISSGGNSTIQILLGNGKGTFQTPISSTSPIQPFALLVGDFNGDGKLDLVALDGLSNATVFLGDGAGHLTAQTPFTASANSSNMVAADLNGDGKLDLVTAGEDEGSWFADVFLGNGDGTFTQGQHLSMVSGLGNPAVGDFNGDGKLDLAIPDVDASAHNVVDVFLGVGDGTFQSAVAYRTAYGGTAVAAADVNNDGKLDLVTSGVSVLLGKGDGTFVNSGGMPVAPGAYNVDIGDFSGDGKLDVALAAPTTSGDDVFLLLGNGKGAFQSPLILPSGTGIDNGLGMADFIGNGRLDLIDYNQTQFSLFLQTALSVSPTTVAFGAEAVGSTSGPQTVTLTNIGTATLTLTITIGGANPTFGETNTCGSSLAAAATCTISVTFSPQSKGARQGTLNITYPGWGSPQKVSLSGTGD
jgi:FG-GAP-like repeat/Abnormal spindle-like microcephaly-assoc'd, ASPM-SPD-2-Hydin